MEALKRQGNEAFKAKRADLALVHYGQAKARTGGGGGGEGVAGWGWGVGVWGGGGVCSLLEPLFFGPHGPKVGWSFRDFPGKSVEPGLR